MYQLKIWHIQVGCVKAITINECNAKSSAFTHHSKRVIHSISLLNDAVKISTKDTTSCGVGGAAIWYDKLHMVRPLMKDLFTQKATVNQWQIIHYSMNRLLK